MSAQQQSVWSIVESEFDCPHTTTEIRVKTASNGNKMYKRQCLNCGRGIGNFLPHATIKDPDIIKPWDDALLDAFLHTRRERYQEISKDARVDWFSQYTEYLQSPEWREKRRIALARDKYLCQGCLERPASQVHHLPGAYKYIPNEPLFMLVSICHACHDHITAVDQDGRDD